MPGYNEDLEGYEYNPEKAKELLKEAGYPDGFKVKVIGDAHSPAWGAPAVGAVMPQLSRVGIDVQPIPMEYGTMVKRVMNDDYQAYIDAFGGIGPRPLGYLMRFHSGNPSNWSNYKNKKVDSLLDKANKTANFDERIKLLQQAEKVIVDDAPIWFDNYNKAVLLTNPGSTESSLTPLICITRILRKFGWMNPAQGLASKLNKEEGTSETFGGAILIC